jgi:DnaJ-domain-containing protein 1
MRIQSVESKPLKRWLIIVALLYLLFPRDLIPDFFGFGVGLIDDLLVMAALIYFYRIRMRRLAARTADESAWTEGETHDEKAGQTRGKPTSPVFDPYQILAIPASSSQETIRSAYRSRMSEYHPDKVAHLGEELQELAHRKALEIQRAYRQLAK